MYTNKLLVGILVISVILVAGCVSITDCNSELDTAIRNAIDSRMQGQYGNYYLTKFNMLSFNGTYNGFVFENDVYFDCRLGSESGQNVNYYYCDSLSEDSNLNQRGSIYAYHIVTDKNGNIERRDNYKAQIFAVIDPKTNKLIDLTCQNVL